MATYLTLWVNMLLNSSMYSTSEAGSLYLHLQYLSLSIPPSEKSIHLIPTDVIFYVTFMSAFKLNYTNMTILIYFFLLIVAAIIEENVKLLPDLE